MDGGDDVDWTMQCFFCGDESGGFVWLDSSLKGEDHMQHLYLRARDDDLFWLHSIGDYLGWDVGWFIIVI